MGLHNFSRVVINVPNPKGLKYEPASIEKCFCGVQQTETSYITLYTFLSCQGRHRSMSIQLCLLSTDIFPFMDMVKATGEIFCSVVLFSYKNF